MYAYAACVETSCIVGPAASIVGTGLFLFDAEHEITFDVMFPSGACVSCLGTGFLMRVCATAFLQR